MAYYQCFKDKARNVYCSKKQVKNHTEGANWVKDALAHYNLKASDILSKPYESDNQPNGAKIYP